MFFRIQPTIKKIMPPIKSHLDSQSRGYLNSTIRNSKMRAPFSLFIFKPKGTTIVNFPTSLNKKNANEPANNITETTISMEPIFSVLVTLHVMLSVCIRMPINVNVMPKKKLSIEKIEGNVDRSSKPANKNSIPIDVRIFPKFLLK